MYSLRSYHQNSDASQNVSSSRKPYLVVHKEKSRIGCLLVIPTLILVVLSAGLSVFLLLWLTVIKRVDRENGIISQSGAYIVDEGTTINDDGTATARLLGLTISSVTTQVAELTSPFLCGLAAYCVAGLWLNEQENPRQDGTNLPTPLQYGLLIRLSSQAGLMPIYDGLRYLLKDRPVAPSFVVLSFVLAIVIYGLTQFVRAADLWLHLTAAAAIFNTTTLIPSSASDLQYGMAFNESLCGAQTMRGCLITDLGWAGYTPSVQQAGWLVSGNASSSISTNQLQVPLSVLTLHDEQDLAVIVPVSVGSDLIWSAPSFGMRAKCTNVTPQCIISQTPSTYNCSAAGHPYLPFNSTFALEQDKHLPGHVMATIDGDQIVGKLWGAYDASQGRFPSNPQSVAVEFRWFVPGEDTSGLVIPNKFVDVSSMGVATAFAECEMSFFNLTVRHNAGRYTLVGEPQRTYGNFSATMWGPLLSQMINTQLHSNLQGRALSESNVDSLMAALNQEISRLSLGFFAGSVLNAPTNDLYRSQSLLVGRYPVAPVLAYTLLLLTYSLLAIGIFIWASIMKTRVVQAPDGTKATSMELAQLQLTDPMMMVAVTFPPRNDKSPSVQTDALKHFVEDEHTARLVVTTDNGPTSDSQFKVRVRHGWNEDNATDY